MMKRMMSRRLAGATLVGLALIMAGCGGGPRGAADEVVPTVSVPEVNNAGGVSVTGEVVPAQDATLSFVQGGRMVELRVEVGDEVEAGDVIARLDTTLLETQLAQAEANLAAAEANLEQTEAGPREAEISEAESNLTSAQAQVAVSAAQRDQTTAAPSESAILEAKAAVEQAELAFTEMELHYRWVLRAETDPDSPEYDGLSDYEVEVVIPSWKEDATEDYNQALGEVQEARARLDQLLEGVDANTARAANAEVGAAAADAAAQEAQVDGLKSGPRAEDIAVAEAQVVLAEASVAQARLALDRATLRAPFSGTVAEVYAREQEYVNATQPILLLADLSALEIETVDLNEIDLSRVAIGDRAEVTFDALEGETFEGTLAYIAPRATEGAGVNYTARIQVEDLPDAIRWGMTAFADIQAGE